MRYAICCPVVESTRSNRDLELRAPDLLAGPGIAVHGDAVSLVRDGSLGSFDLAYLDPPYNRHRYTANYHVWETLVAWDAPEHYGVACKRVELLDESTRSAFNRKSEMPGALAEVVSGVDAEVLVLSYNDESWLDRCLLYTSPSPRDRTRSRMPSSA